MSGAEIFFTILFSLVVVGLLLVVVKLIKYVFRQIKLSFTKPWEDKSKDVFKVEFKLKDEYHDWIAAYYKIDGVWWKQEESVYIDKSWDECKISEPISTLLTLIWEDYDNFTFNTSLGDKYVKLNHNKLLINGDNDLLNMFGHTIRTTHVECKYIWHFVQGIKNHRDSIIKENEHIRLKKLRETGTEKVVNEINKYLEDK